MNPFDDLPEVSEEVDSSFIDNINKKRKLGENEITKRRLKKQRRDETKRRMVITKDDGYWNMNNVHLNKSSDQELQDEAINRINQLQPFIPSTEFVGSKLGYYYTRSAEGLGYVLDVKRRGELIECFVKIIREEQDKSEIESKVSEEDMNGRGSQTNTKEEEEGGSDGGIDVKMVVDKLSKHLLSPSSSSKKFSKALDMLGSFIQSRDCRLFITKQHKKNGSGGGGFNMFEEEEDEEDDKWLIVKVIVKICQRGDLLNQSIKPSSSFHDQNQEKQQEEETGTTTNDVNEMIKRELDMREGMFTLFTTILEGSNEKQQHLKSHFYLRKGILEEGTLCQQSSSQQLSILSNLRCFMYHLFYFSCWRLENTTDSFEFGQEISGKVRKMFDVMDFLSSSQISYINESENDNEQQKISYQFLLQELFLDYQDLIIFILDILFKKLTLYFWSRPFVEEIFNSAKLRRLMFDDGNNKLIISEGEEDETKEIGSSSSSSNQEESRRDKVDNFTTKLRNRNLREQRRSTTKGYYF